MTQAMTRIAGSGIRGTRHPPALRPPGRYRPPARQAGRDATAVADQHGWARHSRSMPGYAFLARAHFSGNVWSGRAQLLAAPQHDGGQDQAERAEWPPDPPRYAW
ncbi:hypothetical protein [Streptomyces sp. NPDC001675]